MVYKKGWSSSSRMHFLQENADMASTGIFRNNDGALIFGSSILHMVEHSVPTSDKNLLFSCFLRSGLAYTAFAIVGIWPPANAFPTWYLAAYLFHQSDLAY